MAWGKCPRSCILVLASVMTLLVLCFEWLSNCFRATSWEVGHERSGLTMIEGINDSQEAEQSPLTMKQNVSNFEGAEEKGLLKRWRKATVDELLAAMDHSQLNIQVNHTCEFPIKSGCAGNPYHLDSCGKADRPNLFQRSTWVIDGEAENANKFLYRLLDGVAQRPPCTLTFVGDSLANQLIFAAVAGALKMGWKMRSFCWDGPGNDWKMEKEPSLTHPCDNRLFDMKFHGAAQGILTLHPQCENLTIGAFMRLESFQRLSKQVAAAIVNEVLQHSTYLLLNWGVHENNQSYTEKMEVHLNDFMLPWLEVGNETGQIEKMAWRSTFPQHFPNPDGSGLWMSKKALKRHNSCAPIRDLEAARWRDHFTFKWIKKAAPYAQLRVVDAFDYFAQRPDLHCFPDCTHFIHSPFAWHYVWKASVETFLDSSSETKSTEMGGALIWHPNLVQDSVI